MAQKKAKPATAGTVSGNGESPRRFPRQERSQRRVASIVEAAGKLLEEVGYVALTTNAIAARAGTSIGSLYQFFPNKDAVVAELVKRFREQLSDFFRNTLTVDMARSSITHFVDVVVDGVESLRDREPGFSSVFSFRGFGNHADEQHLQLEYDIITPLDELLSKAYPSVSDAQRKRCMLVVTETTRVLMSKVANESQANQNIMRGELKRMLGLYLASYFTPDAIPDELRRFRDSED